jgi:DNA replication protein DnaC
MKDATLEVMRQIKLGGMAASYEATLELPVNQHPDNHDLIAQLVDAESLYRSNKKMSLFIRLSKLRYNANLADINYAKSRNLKKEHIVKLADGAYIDRSENILITGATGCGKSYLACALGNQACVVGKRTLYYNMNRLVEQIALAKTDGTLIKWLNRIQKADLVILDDFGLQPLTQSVILIILQILEDRYAKASTIVCSQLPVSKWHQYLADPTIADAILDRLVPKAHRFELMGKSRRKGL